MGLERIEIEAFRCLSRVAVALDPHYNLFLGPNASGKTSLLEALFFLGRGRSFRGRQLGPLIQHGHDEFHLIGHVRTDATATVLGVRARVGETEFRIGGATAGSAAELAQYFAPAIIDPELHRLLEDGPHRRRRYLDWGVFHVEPGFLPLWRRYRQALKQRNSLLHQGAPTRELSAWDPELAASGEQLGALRERYVLALAGKLAPIASDLLGLEVELMYAPGWHHTQGMLAALAHSAERDRRLKMTHNGPHRADIVIQVGGQPVRHRISRGQQKLLVAALILAQVELHAAQRPGRSALLLDDPAAELDSDSLRRLLARVRGLPVQLFVTGLSVGPQELGQPGNLFHVEHGRIEPA
jgi:DNA replication and repair protein RecF